MPQGLGVRVSPKAPSLYRENREEARTHKANPSGMVRLALILLGSSLAVALYAQSATPQDLAGKIDALVTSVMSEERIPGVSVAVLKDDRIVHSAGYGLADIENNVPVTPRTVFRLASISKALTGVLAGRLFERGVLDLDRPIREYVQEWPEKHPPLTCRQLLGHLGGIRHYKGDEVNSTKFYPDLSSSLAIFKDDPLIAAPGERYSYTTYGFTLLGRALEVAAGKSFRELIREEVLAPAGMASTYIDEVAMIVQGRAQGYRRNPLGGISNSALADTSYKLPGGGLCGTAEDLVRLASALLSGRILKPETRELLWTPQSTSDGKKTSYGLGWVVGEVSNRRAVMHSGGQQRVSTFLLIVPEASLAVAVMTNLEGAGAGRIARSIASELIESSSSVGVVQGSLCVPAAFEHHQSGLNAPCR